MTAFARKLSVKLVPSVKSNWTSGPSLPSSQNHARASTTLSTSSLHSIIRFACFSRTQADSWGFRAHTDSSVLLCIVSAPLPASSSRCVSRSNRFVIDASCLFAEGDPVFKVGSVYADQLEWVVETAEVGHTLIRFSAMLLIAFSVEVRY